MSTYNSEVAKLNSERKQRTDSFFTPKEFIRDILYCSEVLEVCISPAS